MKQTLSNDLLTVEVFSAGAELQSIVNNRTHHQYLWQGDSRFWGRRSPVLFPIVGAVWQGKYRMDGNEIPMGQHGFARDMEFTPMENVPEDEAWFFLESSEETLSRYPRRFRLEIGYRLQGERLTVMWRVRNLDSRPMDFQIGAHPAFNLPEFNASDPVHGYFNFDNRTPRRQTIVEKGCVGEGEKDVVTDAEGMLPIGAETFADDAIIFADGQVHRVSMLDKSRRPYLSLLFRAPLVGLWSPSADCPFVCIEPWWGRADRVGFCGEFSQREWISRLEPGETREFSYMILFEDI